MCIMNRIYNIKPDEIPHRQEIIQAIEYRVIKAKALLKELCSVSFKDRDSKRINDILERIEWDRQMVDELKGIL